MLHQFLTTNRAVLIDRCRDKVAKRPAPKASSSHLQHGVPVLIDQLIDTLKEEETVESIKIPDAAAETTGQKPAQTEIGATAMLHGRELLKQGFTVDQVVHDYGDLCQAVTELAFEDGTPIEVPEFRTLNRCLDDAIAGAVSEFAYQTDTLKTGKSALAEDDRVRALANEQRSHIRTATLAMSAIKAGNVGLNGATGAILEISLAALQKLSDRFLAGAQTAAGAPARHQRISLAEFIDEAKIPAALDARAAECKLRVASVDKSLALVVDRDLLFTAVATLLQNAFKYSARHDEVTLKAYASGDRILIEIGDSGGGLPPGAAETMRASSTQNGTDEPGLGLALSVCRRSVAANNGVLTVREGPGASCVFTIDLPRH